MSTMTDHKERLYGDVQGGRIVCFDHLGGYGQGAVSDEPNAPQWITPLDVWEVISAGENDAWVREFGKPMSCETCKKGFAS